MKVYVKKNLNHIFSKILTLKGISESNYDNYIDPKIKNFLPNPFIFKDMEEAIRKIYFHIIDKNKITYTVITMLMVHLHAQFCQNI